MIDSRVLDYGEVCNATWSALRDGVADHKDPFHLLVLATVTPDSRPGARAMVLQGVDRADSSLYFHTDRRSPKIAEIRANPSVCALALDPAPGVQVRLCGRATIHEQDSLADEHWERAASSVPWWSSAPRTHTDRRLPATFERVPVSMTRQARSHFAVIRVAVEQIDWFQALAGQVRCARLLQADGWAARILPP